MNSLQAVFHILLDAAAEDGYIAAAEEDSPNSPDFDRILDLATDAAFIRHAKACIEELQADIAIMESIQ